MNFQTELAVHMFADEASNPIFEREANDALPVPTTMTADGADMSFGQRSAKSRGRVGFADLLAKSLEQENAAPSEFTKLEDMFAESVPAKSTERFFNNPLAEDDAAEEKEEEEEEDERPRGLKALAGSFNSLVSLFSARRASNEDQDVSVFKNGEGPTAVPLNRRTLRKQFSSSSIKDFPEHIPHYANLDENDRSSFRRRRRSSLTFSGIFSLLRTESSSSLKTGNGSHLPQPSPINVNRNQSSNGSAPSSNNPRKTLSEMRRSYSSKRSSTSAGSSKGSTVRLSQSMRGKIALRKIFKKTEQ